MQNNNNENDNFLGGRKENIGKHYKSFREIKKLKKIFKLSETLFQLKEQKFQ